MNIRSLKNILRVSETGSLNAAAASANLTIQAVAAQLNKIEDHFGLALFQRTSKGMTLTKEGCALLPHIHKLVLASHTLDECVAEIRGHNNKQLCIAMNTTLTQKSTLRLVEYLTMVFSDFDINFSAGETRENMRNLT